MDPAIPAQKNQSLWITVPPALPHERKGDEELYTIQVRSVPKVMSFRLRPSGSSLARMSEDAGGVVQGLRRVLADAFRAFLGGLARGAGDGTRHASHR